MNTPELSVKVVFNGEMRRFPFASTSFQALHDRIAELLGLGATPIVVKYTDEDGDLITMSSDLELRAALVPGKVLRLEISLKAQQTSTQSPQQTLQQPPPFAPAPEVFNPFKAFQHGCGPSIQTQPQIPLHPGSSIQRQAYIPPHHRFPFGAPVTGNWDKNELIKEDWDAMKEQRKAMKAHVKGVHKAMKKGQYPPHMVFPHRAMTPPGSAPPTSGFNLGFAGPPAHPLHPTQSQEKLVARHVKDVTIEDGTRVIAGTPFVKTWRVRNEGIPWPAGCQLAYNSCEKHGASDSMSGPDYVIVEGPVASNVEIDISVPLVAPTKPGRYTGYWKMRTPEGKKFGQRLWVTIVVPSAGGSSDEDKDADKYDALVDIVLGMGFTVKRHRVFHLLQQYNGNVEQVALLLAEKQQKHDQKAAKRIDRQQYHHNGQQQQQQQYHHSGHQQQSSNNISMID